MSPHRFTLCLGLCAIAFLGASRMALAGKSSGPAAPVTERGASTPSRPFSLDFQGVTYSAAFQHNEGTDWFVEMTPPGQTVETWRTLLVLHWLPLEKGSPEDATHRLAAIADRADPRAHALLSENARGGEALVYFSAFSKGRGQHEGSIFRYGHTESSHGLVAVQYSVRFDKHAKPAAARRDLERTVEAIKRFDLGRITLANGRWGDLPPARPASVEASSSASTPR